MGFGRVFIDNFLSDPELFNQFRQLPQGARNKVDEWINQKIAEGNNKQINNSAPNNIQQNLGGIVPNAQDSLGDLIANGKNDTISAANNRLNNQSLDQQSNPSKLNSDPINTEQSNPNSLLDPFGISSTLRNVGQDTVDLLSPIKKDFEKSKRTFKTVIGEPRSWIKDFEGLRLGAYQDTGGKWTIGYGHTSGVKRGDKITLEQAENFITQDILDAIKIVDNNIQVPLNDNQFKAMVGFVFNVGPTKFSNSTLLRKLNNGDYQGAADELPLWIHDDNKNKLPGLIRRRATERELFLRKDD